MSILSTHFYVVAPIIRPPFVAMKLPKINEVIADNFMRILIAGPDVSFSGSPTVSPMTDALCSSVGLPSAFFFLNIKGLIFSSSVVMFLLL